MTHSKPAFTLSEVLIALALLGLVAAFSIPKVLQGSQETHRTAVLKESMAVLADLVYQAKLSGEIKRVSDFNTFVKNRLNYAKYCDNYVLETCYPNVGDGDPGPTYILPNGAMLIDFDLSAEDCTSQACGDAIAIDYNGAAPPNTMGEDVVNVVFSLGNQSILGIAPGSINANPNAGVDNQNFYQRLIE